MHDKDNKPDFLFPWLLELLQHSNGYIRYAAIRMFEIEFGPLTVHIRYPGKEFTDMRISPPQADSILFTLYRNLRSLMDHFWRSEYRKYKDVSTLPVGVYKSIQLLFFYLEDLCGEEYLYFLEKKFNSIN